MFCPKCGTQNPETGKFCRSCGVDLGNVSAALSGNLPATFTDPAVAEVHHQARRRNDPNEVYADAVKSIISGVGFLIVSMALLFTGVAGGRVWWWAMLFPAFTFLAKGISEYMKYGKMESSRLNQASAPYPAELNQTRVNASLPPTQTDYVSPADTKYKTGDLVPPSVTDSTTKLLELDVDPEGQTRALPKK